MHQYSCKLTKNIPPAIMIISHITNSDIVIALQQQPRAQQIHWRQCDEAHKQRYPHAARSLSYRLGATNSGAGRWDLNL